MNKKGFSRNILILLYSAGIIAVTGCTYFKEIKPSQTPVSKPPDNRPATNDVVSVPSFGDAVTFSIGEHFKYSDGLIVTLVSIGDSRCKQGVVCIWEGELSPLFRITGGTAGDSVKEIRLGTSRVKQVTESDYIFSLITAEEATTALHATISVVKAAEPKACSQEAKLCPDGSYVSRTGPSCEFAKCPSPVAAGTECHSNADCPANYICEVLQGSGTSCPSTDSNCTPTFTIIKGICKSNLKAGSACSSDQDCQTGLLCHAAICTDPIGKQCSGSSDTSCPEGYQCIQSCGPPVSHLGDPPPPYFCELNEYAAKPRNCPICLAENTRIDTPLGMIAVQNVQQGDEVWTTNSFGLRVTGRVLRISRTPVPATHRVVHLVLDDGRELFVSPEHPVGDGRVMRDLAVGDRIDFGKVLSIENILYQKGYTYDILPSGATGLYWANGIHIGSTLFPGL